MKKRLPNRRVTTPTVIQMEAVECGAAALAIILGYHKRIVPLEQLREECGVSRDGSKALNVLKAARKYGMEAKGFKHDIPSLGKLTLPAILFWNFNHFVVLEGFSRGGRVFHINDPGSGRRKVGYEEFNESYTGVVLTFVPGEDFRTGGKKNSVSGFLLERLRGNEAPFVYAFLCAFLLVIPGAAIPAFTRIFVDDYLMGSEKEWLRPLLTAMGIALVVQMGLTALQQQCITYFKAKLSLVGSGRFFNHILRLPVSYFSQRFAGEIGSRLALNTEVADIVGGQLAKTFLDGVLVVLLGAIMFLYDPVLAGISVTVAILNALILQASTRARADRNRTATQAYGKLVGTGMNGLQMIETLKATGGEDEFFGRWAGYQARALRDRQSLTALSQYLATGPQLLTAAATTLTMGVGAFLIMDGVLTLGTFIAFQVLAGQFTGPLNSLIQFANNLPLLGANITRIDDVLKAPEDPIYRAESSPETFAGKTRLSGRVEITGVTFGYSPLEPPIIKDFSLNLAPGARVALVGSSGSGKSTVTGLVAGMYQPWAGTIKFDGHSVEEIPRMLFANSVAMVNQDIVFFSGTARDNLTFWDPSLPDTAIHQACQDAEIASVLLSRPGGYRGEIGEGGSNLSGGQRQRLEIARALVHDPSLLILDEATSALDASTEAAIDRHLRQRGCACLIVAHRLSTVRDADEIIVMEHGEIVERGTFQELHDRKGAFYRLVQQ